MTAKEFLGRYLKAKKEVQRIERQLAEVDDLIGSITIDPTDEHVQTSPEPDQIGKLVASRSDIVADLVDARAKALDVMQEVYGVISKVGNVEYQILLQERYIKGSSWRKIAEAMNYSEPSKSIFKVHKRALAVIEKIINWTPKDTFRS